MVRAEPQAPGAEQLVLVHDLRRRRLLHGAGSGGRLGVGRVAERRHSGTQPEDGPDAARAEARLAGAVSPVRGFRRRGVGRSAAAAEQGHAEAHRDASHDAEEGLARSADALQLELAVLPLAAQPAGVLPRRQQGLQVAEAWRRDVHHLARPVQADARAHGHRREVHRRRDARRHRRRDVWHGGDAGRSRTSSPVCCSRAPTTATSGSRTTTAAAGRT